MVFSQRGYMYFQLAYLKDIFRYIFESLVAVYLRSQNNPVHWVSHPTSHLPVNLLHDAPSLKCPLQPTHCRFEMYCLSAHTKRYYFNYLLSIKHPPKVCL